MGKRKRGSKQDRSFSKDQDDSSNESEDVEQAFVAATEAAAATPSSVVASSLQPEPGVGSLAPTLQKATVLKKFDHSSKRLIVVLERANLETVKAGRNYELLNCDDHAHILRKHHRNIADARPDIAHQILLTLLDSPLNKAGLLQVYVHTERNVLIEINPQTRIPRTFKRFAGLMVQLLHEMNIKAAGSNQTLLKVIKNPVTAHLPPNARIIGTSVKAPRLVAIRDWVAEQPNPDQPIVFVLGAMARGFVEVDYVDTLLSFSQYPLSAAMAAARLVGAYESLWNIL